MASAAYQRAWRALVVLLVAPLVPLPAHAQSAQDVRLKPCQGLLVAGQFTTNATNGSEALAGTQAVCALTVRAACANTVDVQVGPTALNASTAKGYPLAPCESVEVPAKDLANVFLDSGTTAATVAYLGVLGP